MYIRKQIQTPPQKRKEIPERMQKDGLARAGTTLLHKLFNHFLSSSWGQFLGCCKYAYGHVHAWAGDLVADLDVN